MGKKIPAWHNRQPINKQAAKGMSYSWPSFINPEYIREPIRTSEATTRSITSKSLRVALKVFKKTKQLKLSCNDCKRLGFYTQERCLLCKLNEKDTKELLAAYRIRLKKEMHRVGKKQRKNNRN